MHIFVCYKQNTHRHTLNAIHSKPSSLLSPHPPFLSSLSLVLLSQLVMWHGMWLIVVTGDLNRGVRGCLSDVLDGAAERRDRKANPPLSFPWPNRVSSVLPRRRNSPALPYIACPRYIESTDSMILTLFLDWTQYTSKYTQIPLILLMW